MAPRVSVVGIGNTLMGDDGVGVRIAERLRQDIGDREGVEIVTGHLAGMRLMPAVMASDDVIFVDAVALNDEPGAVYRMDPDAAGITGLRSTTSHGMGIPYLITNARLQGHFANYLVYGVHIGDIMVGPDTLTPAVEAAVPIVVEHILADIDRIPDGHS